MSKHTLRRLEVNGHQYLWSIWHHSMHWGAWWSATLRIFSADQKNGYLEVRYEAQHQDLIFPNFSLVSYVWTNEQGLDVHEPKTVVRVIRYARNQLGWKPDDTGKPLIIENGYQLLNDLGYGYIQDL